MKQRFFSLITIFFLACTSVHAQKGVAHYKKLYKQAKQYGDVTLAVSALHHIILLGKINYKDTLAAVYSNNGLYSSGYLVTKELLEKRPENAQLLGFMFSNASSLGRIEEALTYIDALLKKEPTNIVYLYQKANILIRSSKASKALATINVGLATPVIKKQMMVDGVKGNRIAVPIQSQLYYLKGLVYYSLKDIVGAKDAFTKGLQLAPEHKNIIASLEVLNKSKK